MACMSGTNRVVHFEIPADDPPSLTKFYGDLFGWSFQKSPSAGDAEYWLCETGNDEGGINGAIMKRQHPQHPVTNYVDVADLDAAIEKATQLGAQVCFPKTPVPGIGSIAIISDPQGNPCGLFERNAESSAA